MSGNTGLAIVVAAIILGFSVLGGSFLIKDSIEQGTVAVAGLQAAIEKSAAAAPPPRQAAARPGRPDPNRRYRIDIEGAPVIGPADAKVTVAEFSDFQCPFCKRVGPTLEQIKAEYGDDVRIAFKHLPLSIHAKAPAAHAAAEASNRQGKFWEMHDLIFANQAQMGPEKYLEYAAEIGLDIDRYKADLTSQKVKARIDSDSKQAANLGVTGTPAFFVNGRYLSGAQPFASFKKLIDEELAMN